MPPDGIKSDETQRSLRDGFVEIFLSFHDLQQDQHNIRIPTPDNRNKQSKARKRAHDHLLIWGVFAWLFYARHELGFFFFFHEKAGGRHAIHERRKHDGAGVMQCEILGGG